MILLIGLVIFAVAALVAVLGVGTNSGVAHGVQGDFGLFGQHITGLSTGQLFLFGIIVGLVAALGLSILRGFFVRGLAARDLRKELKKSQAETATLRANIDRLSKEIEVERAQKSSQKEDPPADNSAYPIA